MRVVSNTAVSLDGRIGTNGEHSFNVASDEDRRRMGLLRAKADAVLVGGRTFRVGPQLILEPAELRRKGVRRPLVNAVLTRKGVVSFIGDEWKDSGAVLHVFGPDQPSHANTKY